MQRKEAAEVELPKVPTDDPSFIAKDSPPEKFVPTKIIQKKGVNVSKIINRPK